VNEPRLPGYDLPRVFSLRDEICTETSCHLDTLLVGEYYEDFVDLVCGVIPEADDDAIERSARCLLGRALSAETLRDFAWRIAGNVRRLKAGKAALPWWRQRVAEWVPLHVEAIRFGRNRRDEPGAELTLRALAGSLCPSQVRTFWTRAQCRYVSRRVGFNPVSRPPRHFAGPAHLVNLAFYGLFEPKLCQDRPGFHRVDVPGTMVRRNVAIIAGRLKKPCPTPPFHYTHTCAACTIGYEHCDHALHRRTFVRGTCAGCRSETALFDPDRPEFCVECTHTRDTTPAEK
jgi:hypothetical protein